LDAALKTLGKERDILEANVLQSLDDGLEINPGNLTASVRAITRVTPKWKEIALTLGADEERIRAETTPSISRKVIVEQSAACVIRHLASA